MSHAAFVVMDAKDARGRVLVPCDEDGLDLIRAQKIGKEVLIDWWSARNPLHHRLLFHVFRLCRDSGVWDGTMDAFLQWVKFATGHFDMVFDHTGHMQMVPKSIAFAAMNQAQFIPFFDKAVQAICDRLLDTENWEEIRDEVIRATERNSPEAIRKAHGADRFDGDKDQEAAK